MLVGKTDWSVSCISAILPMYPSKNATLVTAHAVLTCRAAAVPVADQAQAAVGETLCLLLCPDPWQVLQFSTCGGESVDRPPVQAQLCFPMNPLMNRSTPQPWPARTRSRLPLTKH